ncbi:hypothetical protein D3C83_207420 [compost metagenome]
MPRAGDQGLLLFDEFADAVVGIDVRFDTVEDVALAEWAALVRADVAHRVQASADVVDADLAAADGDNHLLAWL